MTNFNSNRVTRVISTNGQGPIVIEGGGVIAELGNGVITVTSGEVELTGSARLSGRTARPIIKIGQAKIYGSNQGWIYCETELGEPFLVAPKDSGVMKWQAAVAYAARQNSALPDRDQLMAMFEARDMGAFRDTFNTSGSRPDGWYWSARHMGSHFVGCQNFGEGGDCGTRKSDTLSVRLVRRYSLG